MTYYLNGMKATDIAGNGNFYIIKQNETGYT